MIRVRYALDHGKRKVFGAESELGYICDSGGCIVYCFTVQRQLIGHTIGRNRHWPFVTREYSYFGTMDEKVYLIFCGLCFSEQ